MSGGLECTDEALWQLAVNGDGDAFGALFDRHRDRVLSHALKILRSTHLAEDITAVVFYEAWRRREYVRVVNGSIVAWLLVTANNTIRNHIRERRRYSIFLSQLPAPAAGRDIADDYADAAELDERAGALREAFALLKPLDRDVLTLCVVEGLSVRDAAAALMIAEGTVKSRLHRAKARLGDLYGEVSGEQSVSSSVPGRSE